MYIYHILLGSNQCILSCDELKEFYFCLFTHYSEWSDLKLSLFMKLIMTLYECDNDLINDYDEDILHILYVAYIETKNHYILHVIKLFLLSQSIIFLILDDKEISEIFKYYCFEDELLNCKVDNNKKEILDIFSNIEKKYKKN